MQQLLGDRTTGREWLWPALVHHRLGHADEARRCLDRAARWIEQHEEDAAFLKPPWPDRLEMEVLHREAQATIQAPSASSDRP